MVGWSSCFGALLLALIRLYIDLYQSRFHGFAETSEYPLRKNVSSGGAWELRPSGVAAATSTPTYLSFCLGVQTALSPEEVPPPTVGAAQQLLAGTPLRARRYHLGPIPCFVGRRRPSARGLERVSLPSMNTSVCHTLRRTHYCSTTVSAPGLPPFAMSRSLLCPGKEPRELSMVATVGHKTI